MPTCTGKDRILEWSPGGYKRARPRAGRGGGLGSHTQIERWLRSWRAMSPKSTPRPSSFARLDPVRPGGDLLERGGTSLPWGLAIHSTPARCFLPQGRLHDGKHLPKATKNRGEPFMRTFRRKSAQRRFLSFAKNPSQVRLSAVMRRSGVPTCPGSTRIALSRMTIVASVGSSPVNVKWNVASRPSEACRWKMCGRTERNERIDLGLPTAADPPGPLVREPPRHVRLGVRAGDHVDRLFLLPQRVDHPF